jgi:hypothetical protein
MVQTDRGQRRNGNSIVWYNVRGIQSTAHAHLQNDDVDLGPFEDLESDEGEDLKAGERGVVRFVCVLYLSSHGVEQRRGHGDVVEGDRVMDGDEVWAVESADAEWGFGVE